MFSSIPGHYSLPVISNFPPIVAMKNVSRHCQSVLWGKNCPQWRIAMLRGHLWSSCTPAPLHIVPSLSPLRSLLPCKYFHNALQLRFRDLSAMLFGITSLSLVIGKAPKQFKSNYFSVTLPPDLSHWLSYQGQSFPDSFSFHTYALTWFGSSLMVHEILKSKISQMKKLLLLRRHLFLPATSVAVLQVKAPSFFLKCTFVVTGLLLFRSLNVAKSEIHKFLLPLTDCNGLH